MQDLHISCLSLELCSSSVTIMIKNRYSFVISTVCHIEVMLAWSGFITPSFILMFVKHRNIINKNLSHASHRMCLKNHKYKYFFILIDFCHRFELLNVSFTEDNHLFSTYPFIYA